MVIFIKEHNNINKQSGKKTTQAKEQDKEVCE